MDDILERVEVPPGRRWCAVITYSTVAGPLDVEFFVEELLELRELVERGRDWNSILSVAIILSTSMRSYETTVARAGEI